MSLKIYFKIYIYTRHIDFVASRMLILYSDTISIYRSNNFSGVVFMNSNSFHDNAANYKLLFDGLREKALSRVFAIEDSDKYEKKIFESAGGATTLSIIRGKVFEKISICRGEKERDIPKDAEIPDNMKDLKNLPGGKVYMQVFEICSHMMNPKVPVGTLSLRYRSSSNGRTGGGTDLSPYIPFKEDTELFSGNFKKVCANFSKDYDGLRENLKKTFWLKYRNEPRGGLAGIAFDLPAQEFDFIQTVGNTFIDTYFSIVEKRKMEPYTEEERNYLLFRRGRWVEFNLIEDEGFKYGLEIGVNPEVMILQTLPPSVKF